MAQTVERAPILGRASIATACADGLRQLGTLIDRSARVTLRDAGLLTFAVGHALFLALLLSLAVGVIGRRSGPEEARLTGQLLFLLATASLWLGCANAAREIVKERGARLEERWRGLLVPTYYLSKVIILAAVGILQTTLLYAIVAAACRLEGAWLTQWLALNATCFNGMALGLLVSAASRSPATAAILAPMVVIPQAVFAGVMGPLEGTARQIAAAVNPVYWACDALKATLTGKITGFQDPLTGEFLLRETGSVAYGIAVLTGFALAYAAATLLALSLESGSNSALKRKPPPATGYPPGRLR